MRLVNALADLIDDEYGGRASYNEIKSICLATIKLFHCLEGQDNSMQRIVSFIVVKLNVFWHDSFVVFVSTHESQPCEMHGRNVYV